MATITINIPDAAVPRVLEAMCSTGGYEPSDGLTKGAFAKRMLAQYVKRIVFEYEAMTAQRAALIVVPPPTDVDVS